MYMIEEIDKSASKVSLSIKVVTEWTVSAQKKITVVKYSLVVEIVGSRMSLHTKIMSGSVFWELLLGYAEPEYSLNVLF